MEPLISVIIPTHNGSKTLEAAAKSVLAQQYSSLELLIIDDGSSDSTAAVAERLVRHDARVRLFKNSRQLGFVASLNRGLREAHGVYIARIDDDDLWIDPNKLSLQAALLQSCPRYVLVGAGLVKRDAQGRERLRYLFPETDEVIRRSIMMTNCFGHSAVLFSRRKAVEAGGYDARYGFFADRALWMRLGQLGKFHNLQSYLVSYLDKELDGSYRARDLQIRRRLWRNVELRWRFRRAYPGFWKAALLCLCSWAYSYLPKKDRLWPLIFKLRVAWFGKPSYQYSNEKNS